MAETKSLVRRHYSGEGDLRSDALGDGAFDQLGFIRSAPDENQPWRLRGVPRDQGDCVKERIDTLGGAQFAHVKKIGRIGIDCNGRKFVHAQPIVDDPRELRRRAGATTELLRDIAAFEQENIGAGNQQPFDRHIGSLDKRPGAVIETAAMRRIGPHRPVSA